MNLDAEIDRLYQLPAGEFTAARNELAKRAGGAGGDVRKLAKPNAAAWAVNQLYWQRRAVFDRLVEAARGLRSAHGRVLGGKSGDVNAAESAHKDAVKAAADEIRALLREAGDAASAQTMQAVTETLQALPGSERPGRLTKPLRPAGFEALAGLVPRSGPVLRALTVAPPAPARPDRSAGKPAKQTPAQIAAAAKREAADRKQQIARAQQELTRARAAEEKAAALLARARQAHARAEQDRARLEDQLQFAEKHVRDRAAAARKQEDAVKAAQRDRERAQAAVDEIGNEK